jgi:D-alanyl-D-alanine dipeptidase
MGAVMEVQPPTVTLLSDARVASVPVRECGQPLCEVDDGRGGLVLVREGVAERLVRARGLLGCEGRLLVHEGLRRLKRQEELFAIYLEELRRRDPLAGGDELYALCSRFVAPPEVAPHVAGAAVDVSLIDWDGWPIDLGTPVDASPESSGGACYFDAAGISADARRARAALADAMGVSGFVNYPTEWWHWSYGDRYWAYVVGAPAALYGPVDRCAS